MGRARSARLWFVDIKKASNPSLRSRQPAIDAAFETPEQVGFILPAEGGGFVAGLQSGLFHFDDRTGAFDPIVQVEPEHSDNRLNDGVVDPAGRVWFGTMDNREKTKSGAFYRFDRGTLSPTGIDRITITNGPAVSPDGRTLYLVDTLAGTIQAADIRDDGSLGEPRPFVKIAHTEGHPDGPTVDSQGCVWIALYNGLGSAALFAGWRPVADGPLPGLQHHQDRVWRRRLADGVRYDGTAIAQARRHREAAADRIALQFQVDVPGIPCPLAQL